MLLSVWEWEDSRRGRRDRRGDCSDRELRSDPAGLNFSFRTKPQSHKATKKLARGRKAACPSIVAIWRSGKGKSRFAASTTSSRAEERRGGKECGRTGRSRWARNNKKKTNNEKQR